jgi:hypothetical protein
MTITIYAGDQVIKRQELFAQAYCKIVLHAEPFNFKTITIKFSNFSVDEVGRRLSFLLQDTNLFSELDTF